jgi:HAMP domain-containing protein
MDETTVRAGADRKTSRPGFAHFYSLVALILLVAGGMAYLFVQLKGADQTVRQELGESATQLTVALDQQQKVLKGHLSDLEVTLQETRKELGKLSSEVGQLRKEMADHKAAMTLRLDALEAKDLELAQALKTEAAALAEKVEVARAEFAKDQEGIKTVVAQIQDDSKYIVGELGKKAEKAYLRFMERKLKKQIGAVSDKVDTVKGDLEQQIVATQTKIQEMAGSVGETIKKKVEEHVKIDFVPSQMDED